MIIFLDCASRNIYKNTAQIDDTPPPAPFLRWISNTLGLYGFCGRSACRRARACRGQPLDCVVRYAPLVPEDAGEGAKALVDGHYDRLDFDAVYDEAPDEIEALAEWTAQIKRATWKHAGPEMGK
jgi:hypothetical protein